MVQKFVTWNTGVTLISVNSSNGVKHGWDSFKAHAVHLQCQVSFLSRSRISNTPKWHRLSYSTDSFSVNSTSYLTLWLTFPVFITHNAMLEVAQSEESDAAALYCFTLCSFITSLYKDEQKHSVCVSSLLRSRHILFRPTRFLCFACKKIQ